MRKHHKGDCIFFLLLKLPADLITNAIQTIYPALLLPLAARMNAPEPEVIFGDGTRAPERTSRRSFTRSTKNEKPRLLFCSTRPSRRNDPLRWRMRPYLS